MATRKTLRALFDEASEIEDKQARARFLEEVCAGDAALRASIEELLRSGDSAGGFLADRKREGLPLAAPMYEREGDRIGRYKLLQKIGEGGCGVVYMAEQLEPVRRRVALKVIKLGMDTASMIGRFEVERQALALMDHPGIARVLDAGATDRGRPFFVMELVRGAKITEFCEQNDLSTVERLQLFIQVCQAVQHAHQKGIIHRDLKPSNVLVTSDDGVPLPKVIDFGIAKATADVHLTDKTVFTRFEMFLGTPAYMSPEQAELNANDLDTRTDIYSLGVLLYELLTGRPPFESEAWLKSGIDALRKAIREKEPTRPSTSLALELRLLTAAHKNDAQFPPLSRRGDEGEIASRLQSHPGALTRRRYNFLKETVAQLRGDLDWVVLKALEKDRKRRYETASAFAMDLQRHLRHEPVLARPPSALYLLQKTARRNRSAFAIGAAVALALVAGVIFATRDAIKTRRAEKVERDLRQKAETSQKQEMLARNEADAANRTLTRNLFVREWLDAEALLEEGLTGSALAWFARAARQHPDDAAVQTRLLSLLTENTFVVPKDRPLVHGSYVNTTAFLPDRRHLATAANDGTVRVWPLSSSAAPLVLSNRFETPAVAVAPGESRLLVDDARSVSLWDLNGSLVSLVPFSHKVNQRLPISADGRFAAIYGPGESFRVWDIEQLKPVGLSFEKTRTYPPVTGFSPDGKYMLGTEDGRRISAWETASGRLVWQTPQTPGFQGNGPVEAEVHPGGKRVIVSCWLGFAGGELSGWTFEPSLSPDAPPASASSEGWILPTPSPIGAWCFSEDGHELYVGDAAGHLGIVNLTTHELQTLNGEHIGRLTWMGLSKDGQRLATGSVDGIVRLWDTRMKAPDPIVITNREGISDAKFSPDSQWVLCNNAKTAELRDAQTGALLKRMQMDEVITHLAFSPNSRRIVACGDNRTIVWDAETGAALFPAVETARSAYVEFSSDGRYFSILTDQPSIQVRETETGRQIGPTLTNSSRGMGASFNPDGHSLVVPTDSGIIEFWSLPDGRRTEKAARHKAVIWAAQWSADGKLLLTGSRDRTAALWDADSGSLIHEFRHEQEVYSVLFSPDNARIVTGDAGGKTHVWDTRTGRQLFSLPAHHGGLWFCELSADGQVLLTGDDAGNSRLWQASSGLPLSGWVHNGASLRRNRLSADGRMVLSLSGTGTLRLWPVIRAPLPAPSWLPELAEALAGHRLRTDGAPEIVPAESWETLEASLSSEGGDDFYNRWAHWFFVERLKEHPAPFVP
jgi:WD40 repeat protein/serine/threonine protein kinase